MSLSELQFEGILQNDWTGSVHAHVVSVPVFMQDIITAYISEMFTLVLLTPLQVHNHSSQSAAAVHVHAVDSKVAQPKKHGIQIVYSCV